MVHLFSTSVLVIFNASNYLHLYFSFNLLRSLFFIFLSLSFFHFQLFPSYLSPQAYFAQFDPTLIPSTPPPFALSVTRGAAEYWDALATNAALSSGEPSGLCDNFENASSLSQAIGLQKVLHRIFLRVFFIGLVFDKPFYNSRKIKTVKL